jgi:uncharacterized protein (UPF0335 family)
MANSTPTNTKPSASGRLLKTGIVTVFIVWGLYAILALIGNFGQWGLFGDTFGALNTLFTGLAFVGLLAALWHEREASTTRQKEHHELIQETRAQVAEARRNFRLTALSARIECLIVEIGELKAEQQDIEHADAHDEEIDQEHLDAVVERIQKLSEELKTHRGTLADVAFGKKDV